VLADEQPAANAAKATITLSRLMAITPTVRRSLLSAVGCLWYIVISSVGRLPGIGG
jgi:hypothetical protein